jgi:hypothetical protein
MNPAKLIVAAVVLAAAVFLITFAMAYLGGAPSSVKPPTSVLEEVTFTFPDGEFFPMPPKPSEDSPGKAPVATTLPAIGEVSSPGDKKEYTHDFWFKNDADKALPLSLNAKNCQCTYVYVWTAPDDVTAIPNEKDRARVTKEIEDRVQPQDLLKSDESKSLVPKGGVGWVRLKWSSDHEGSKMLNVQLWVGDRGLGRTKNLGVGAFFVRPMTVENTQIDLSIDEISTSDLPKPFEIKCWSQTRTLDKFPLKAKLVHSRLEPGKNPFVIGELKPLSEKELAALRADAAAGPPLPALSGWRVPVTLLARSPDASTPFEMGRFAQWVELSLEDSPEPPLEVRFFGRVTGSLSAAGEGRVQFKPFKRDRGIEDKIDVTAEAEVAKLTVDDRTAKFLSVELPKEPRVVGSHKVWTVTIKVKPNQVSGEFPSKDDQNLRDTAVYLKAERSDAGEPACIRIPVGGTASEPQ